MAVGLSSGKGKGKGKTKYPCGVCWNCGSKDHYKNKCPEPAADSKTAKEPKRKPYLRKLKSPTLWKQILRAKQHFP